MSWTTAGYFFSAATVIDGGDAVSTLRRELDGDLPTGHGREARDTTLRAGHLRRVGVLKVCPLASVNVIFAASTDFSSPFASEPSPEALLLAPLLLAPEPAAVSPPAPVLPEPARTLTG